LLKKGKEWKGANLVDIHQEHQGLENVACEELLRELGSFNLGKSKGGI